MESSGISWSEYPIFTAAPCLFKQPPAGPARSGSPASIFTFCSIARVCAATHRRLRETARRPVSRVLSAPCGARRPFLWDAHCCAPHATNPGGGAGMPLRHRHGGTPQLPPAAPIRSCSRWGLPCRLCHQKRGALLPHRFTLAAGRAETQAAAVCFLWHFPWGRPRRPLAGTVFSWSPDFPPPGCKPRQRPPGRLARGGCALCCDVSSR